ncbi:Flp pilus assembly protein, ATPase CpaE [Austwickia chelonae]|nr:hypothetical protein [Austwickia chelonae]SEW02023.1 Flp pilus assembly protein, ATPase CpaE [Austwickia chelonae]
MRTTLLLAVPQAWETAVVEALTACARIELVRRCADLPELLSTAAAHLGECALIGSTLPGLDRTAVAELHAAGVHVVGMTSPGNEGDERRLRQLGIATVLPADTPADRLQTALLGRPLPPQTAPLPPETHRTQETRTDPTNEDPDTPRLLPDLTSHLAQWASEPQTRPTGDATVMLTRTSAPAGDNPSDDHDEHLPGRTIAVWGPAGAPGRSTIALNLAEEAALAGSHTLLIDADPYGGVQAQLLGLLDESPGLAGAVRAANQGHLDRPGLQRYCSTVSTRLSVLTGITRADRWPELRPSPLEDVLHMSRLAFEFVVIDCGFNLEDDEELSYDTAAPRRNASTLTSLAHADHLVVVGAAEPIGLQRLVRGLQELDTVQTPQARTIVLNRVRAGAVGPDPRNALAAALDRFAGIREAVYVPDDRAALDLATLEGRTLAECAPHSPAREPLTALARILTDRTPAPPDTRRRTGHGRRWPHRLRTR